MDLSTLALLPTEHITHDNRQRRADLVWRVNHAGTSCYIVMLLEFQRQDDWLMPLRINSYSNLLLHDLAKGKDMAGTRKLPLLLPIVIYTGDAKWKTPIDLADMFHEYPKALSPFLPRQRYFLIDVKHMSMLSVEAADNLSAIAFALERAASGEEVLLLMNKLRDCLPAHIKAHIHDAFINFLSCVVIRDSIIVNDLMHCKTLQEACAMFEERRPLWLENIHAAGREKGRVEGLKEGRMEGLKEGRMEGAKEGRMEGAKEGRMEGLMESILAILESRFGKLANDITDGVARIPSADILKQLTIAAASSESLNTFMLTLNQIKKQA